jgi:hypothetical protein
LLTNNAFSEILQASSLGWRAADVNDSIDLYEKISPFSIEHALKNMNDGQKKAKKIVSGRFRYII